MCCELLYCRYSVVHGLCVCVCVCVLLYCLCVFVVNCYYHYVVVVVVTWLYMYCCDYIIAIVLVMFDILFVFK